MKKYRPKKFVMYSYGTIYRAYVSCHPNSKWEFGGIFGGSIVKLSNGHTTIYVDKDQFEKNWIEVL
jgi:hypothetical protein